MQLLYSLLLSLAAFFLLPWFVVQAIVRKKYIDNLKQRFGWLPVAVEDDGRPAIWIHAVSVGEALTAGSLLSGLKTRFPGHRLIVSTTTATGQAVAKAQLKEADGVCYFPFDWRFAVRRALRVIRPRIVVLMESELWFNFLSECRAEGIAVIVANGRISDRSFPRSMKFRFFVSRLYALVDRFAMQSRTDLERAVALGADPGKVVVTGNLKYDLGRQAGDGGDEKSARLDQLFALSGSPLIVAGSTTEGEEEPVLDAWEMCRRRGGRVRLLLAPRHPERFDSVARLLESRGVSFARRSAGAGAPSADVVLLDSIGELASIYRFASAVFIGGSLVPKGGHNILEPALYSRPIVVGPYMENFRDIAADFLRRDALIKLRSGGAPELAGALAGILEDENLASRLGTNARAAVEASRGATSLTVDLIADLIGPH